MGDYTPPAHEPIIQQRYYQGWTRGETEEAIRLRRAGYTAAQIARNLSRSRCSVIGKLHRLGLSGGAK